MKTISLVIASIVLIMPVCAFAQTSGHSEQNLYGQKTNLTKYAVGACIDNEGGLWQQISDGTWAPPNDILNTCRTQGMYQNWTYNPQTNPWLKSGIDYNYPNYQSNPSYYPYGTNYPGPNGGYTDYNTWLSRCVVMQTILPLPECQAIPTIGNLSSFNLQINSSNSKNNSTTNTILAILAGFALSKLF